MRGSRNPWVVLWRSQAYMRTALRSAALRWQCTGRMYMRMGGKRDVKPFRRRRRPNEHR